MKKIETKEPLSNGSKQKHANNYNYFVETHGLTWERPHFKMIETIPLIPSTENVTKIISSSTPKYATIFTILAETGLEADELATMTRNQIDTEQGIISAKGCKGHASRTFKLKNQTAEMLRIYMFKYSADKPFPTSKIMGEQWRKFRKKLSKKLNQLELEKVQIKKPTLTHKIFAINNDAKLDFCLSIKYPD